MKTIKLRKQNLNQWVEKNPTYKILITGKKKRHKIGITCHVSAAVPSINKTGNVHITWHCGAFT